MSNYETHMERSRIVDQWLRVGVIGCQHELDRISGCDYITTYTDGEGTILGTENWYRGLADDELFATLALVANAKGAT